MGREIVLKRGWQSAEFSGHPCQGEICIAFRRQQVGGGGDDLVDLELSAFALSCRPVMEGVLSRLTRAQFQ